MVDPDKNSITIDKYFIRKYWNELIKPNIISICLVILILLILYQYGQDIGACNDYYQEILNNKCIFIEEGLQDNSKITESFLKIKNISDN